MAQGDPDGAVEASPRLRRGISTVAAVLAAFALVGSIVSSWMAVSVFDADRFADRTVSVLRSADVRHAVAEAMADQIAQIEPEVYEYRTVLVTVIEDVAATQGFQEIFRDALVDAHRAVFTEDGKQFAVDLSDSLVLVSSTLQTLDPSLAAKIPSGSQAVLVDITTHLESTGVFGVAPALDDAAARLGLFALVLLGVAFVVEPDRHRGLVKVGFAIAGAGLGVLGVTFVLPVEVGDRFSDPGVANAVTDAVGRFLGDLRAGSLWVVGFGVVLVALGSAVAPDRDPVDPVAVMSAVRARLAGHVPTRPAVRVLEGAGLVALGMVVVVARDAVVPLLVTVVGAYLVYLGLYRVLEVTGLPALAPRHGLRAEPPEEHRRLLVRGAASLGVVVVVLALTVVGFSVSSARAREEANEPGRRRCNGSHELCDRRLDDVVFAGAHNAMAAADQPGWLFSEQLHGIDSQLRFGVRALLVKTHYGIPTGVDVDGAEVVVTDTAAEAEARPDASEEEIGSDAEARAKQIAASTPVPAVPKQVYLCHNYCELGATRFADALTDVKRFLERNPNEVVIVFAGDYVTTDDTRAVFEQVGLLDRLWEHDPEKPFPTLGELIEAERNILYFAEHSGAPPGWNNRGYGLWQDTPFTFASSKDFDCDHNRGPKDAPLFQINHWVTTSSPPSVEQGRRDNTHEMLMERVRECEKERGMLPNLLGVNFAEQGDLLGVVDELNGVTRSPSS